MTLAVHDAPRSSTTAAASLAPEKIARVGDVQVVLDRRHKELRWERHKTHAMHLDISVSLAVAQALIRVLHTSTFDDTVKLERSGGYATRIWRGEDATIWVQTVGRFPGHAYGWTEDAALRVADALLYGVRVLGGWR